MTTPVLDFRILGPVEAEVAGCRVQLRRQERGVLAVLLLEAGRPVAIDRMATLLWGERPPAEADSVIQTYVSRLRTALAMAAATASVAAHEVRVIRGGRGYLIEAERDSVDAHRFGDIVASARSVADPRQRAVMLRDALMLWRGPALADVAEPLQTAAAPRWEQLRRSALEARVEADLALGGNGDLVGEVTELAAAAPLSERLAGLLMCALDQAGRRPEALEVFRRIRASMVADLGIEPGAQLQELHRLLLDGGSGPDPVLAALPVAAASGVATSEGVLEPTIPPAARASTPQQLPAASAWFVGRTEELALLEKLLTPAGPATTVAIAAIDGQGGVGKSALAVKMAHQLAPQYGDGQLYVDLHGAASAPAALAPIDVLGRFLRALGVNGTQVPTDQDEAAALFRTLAAGRRLLLVLDNAVDEAQVRPLLPGAAGCAVLVTSRRALSGLDAQHLHLDVLDHAEAVQLLGQLIGAERVAAEPGAAADVVRWCDHLPLAVRIAAARLVSRPAWPLAALAERMADERRRLDELELPGAGVRASFTLSYSQLRGSGAMLDREAVAAFALLGLWDGPDVAVTAAARLWGRPVAETERALERLVDLGLVEAAAPGRYRLHDLLRLYARERAAALGAELGIAALTRLLRFYVTTSWHTLELLRPGNRRLAEIDTRWSDRGLTFSDPAGAAAWLEYERPNLLAAAAQAADADDLAPAVPQLAYALSTFLQVRGYWRDCERLNRIALTAAIRTGDHMALANACHDLAIVLYMQGRGDEAMTSIQHSLALRRRCGDLGGEASGLGALGNVYIAQGRLDEALSCFQRGLSIFEDLSDRASEAGVLNSIGTVQARLGRLNDGLECLQRSLAIFRELGDLLGAARTLNNLSNVYQLQGRYAEALEAVQESLRLNQDLGNPSGQAQCLDSLGTIHRLQGQYDEALHAYRRGRALAREIGVPADEAMALRNLGATLAAMGRTEEARDHWRAALTAYEQLRRPQADEVRALLADSSSNQDSPVTR